MFASLLVPVVARGRIFKRSLSYVVLGEGKNVSEQL